uniref:Peptide encoded by miPEP164a n=1 Tax=Arabidopsis thaliana TaxID=3702 RepID=P164A_ARATH|nr:RecName: Full=Peptide encoded by miPEP164a [Arabidopsis thaliana]
MPSWHGMVLLPYVKHTHASTHTHTHNIYGCACELVFH